MSNFLNDFKLMIREGQYENTYKMAWSKAIVEYCSSLNEYNDIVTIKAIDLGRLMIKYYWNQTIFFDLQQGTNPNSVPAILSNVKLLIAQYYSKTGNNFPIFFEKAEPFLQANLKKEYKKALNKCPSILKENVMYRFIYFNNKYYKNIYDFDLSKKEIYIEKQNALELKNNEQDLYDLINYKWGLILENFNSSPRINKKVKIIDDREIQRKPLTAFKPILNLTNPEHYCFICGEKIPNNELSIDHVIPWSYLYSDDIWNLVYVHKSCNSIKSNSIPTKEEIEKLKIRNEQLLIAIEKAGIHNKITEELKLAIKHQYVEKFYIACKQ